MSSLAIADIIAQATNSIFLKHYEWARNTLITITKQNAELQPKYQYGFLLGKDFVSPYNLREVRKLGQPIAQGPVHASLLEKATNYVRFRKQLDTDAALVHQNLSKALSLLPPGVIPEEVLPGRLDHMHVIPDEQKFALPYGTGTRLQRVADMMNHYDALLIMRG